jgi:hypothetical protein
MTAELTLMLIYVQKALFAFNPDLLHNVHFQSWPTEHVSFQSWPIMPCLLSIIQSFTSWNQLNVFAFDHHYLHIWKNQSQTRLSRLHFLSSTMKINKGQLDIVCFQTHPSRWHWPPNWALFEFNHIHSGPVPVFVAIYGWIMSGLWFMP